MDAGPTEGQLADDAEVLRALAAEFGVDTEYWDWQGQHRTVAESTLRAVLSALDVDAATPASCRAALRARRTDAAARVLPPSVVMQSGRPLPMSLPPGASVAIGLEDGSRLDPDPTDPNGMSELPLGYHRLRVTVDGTVHEAHLIITPDELPLAAIRERPGWGLATQLYSVRSSGSWGVGDLADLRTIAGWAASDHGADFVLINPVHAGEVVTPLDPSPYLPTSRRFTNPIYLRIEDLPEYAALTTEDKAAVDAIGAGLRAELDADRLERDPAWTAKLAALAIMLAGPLPPGRAAAFERYRVRQGAQLERFAMWCALCELHGPDWRDWPASLRHPEGAAVTEFSAEHAGRVGFFAALQWLCEEQLVAVQGAARAGGMALGIVHDVAVGVSPAGADAWAWQDVMASSVRVGAPPDAYSQMGQDWRQPPWRPDRLAETGYAPFREMFGNVLRYCGGLRVDHIIGLFRLWWIPAGVAPLEGTYVHYDHDALVGILALEAHRSGAVLIGEDLGNVEPSARDYLRERGLLGTSILWFESGADGAPLPAEQWREYCLASVTTHDLPPSAGYLAGDHIRLRESLGLLTRSLDDELAAGRQDQQAWIGELRRCGLLAEDASSTEEIVLALHRFLLRTPSRLRCVALTDAVGDRRIQNQPGTTDEYPNWRVPLAGPDGRPMLLDDVILDRRAARLLAVFDPR